MRKLLLATLFLLPAAAPGATAAAPAVSVHVPAISVKVPAIAVKVPAVSIAVPAISVTVPAVSVNVPAVSVTVPPVSVKLPAAATAGVPRLVSTAIPATGLKSLELTVRVGALRIIAADTDSIKVKVQVVRGDQGHFIFTWSSGSGSGSLPAALHLVARRDGTTLRLCLAPETCENSNADVNGLGGWKANWEIVVPKRFHVTLNGGVLDAHVRGIAGGLDSEIGVGNLHASLPNGPVSAKLGVGKVDVAVTSPDYGPVDLATGVGAASFSVEGTKITSGFHREFTSSNQQTNGTGTTAYDIKTGTGAITLRLGVKNAGYNGSGGGE